MDFSVETWACIDVIKICPHIDPELKNAQIMFKKVGGNVKFSLPHQRQEYIGLLKKFSLLSYEHTGKIDFFEIIIKSISNRFFELSGHLLHRHILRDRIHENNNKILRKVINEKHDGLTQYLLTLPKVKTALPDPKNKVLITAVRKNRVQVVEALLDIPIIKENAHCKNNASLFESMFHTDLTIFRKLIALPKVKENVFQIMSKVAEFLNPGKLAVLKSHIGLTQFNEYEIIYYAIEVSRAGHVLGLSNSYLPDDVIFPMNFDGSYSSKSLSWIIDNVVDFIREAPDSELRRKMRIIAKIFETASYYRREMLNDNFDEKPNQMSHFKLFNQLLLNRMIYLISGWKGHSVSVVVCKVSQYRIFVSVTNRGAFGDAKFGTKIYEVTHLQALNADWIRKIQKTKKQTEFLALLKQVIDVDAPLLSLPQKSQKYPTCGYVNKLAAIEPMLLLLRAKFSGEIYKFGGLKRTFDKYKRYDYKKITYTFRNQETKRIVSMIESQYYHSELMYDLVRSIISQHPGKTDHAVNPQKFEQECERARNLLKALPKPCQEKFKNKHSELYDLIDFNGVLNPSQKWILVDYHKKRGQNSAPNLSQKPQNQSTLSLRMK